MTSAATAADVFQPLFQACETAARFPQQSHMQLHVQTKSKMKCEKLYGDMSSVTSCIDYLLKKAETIIKIIKLVGATVMSSKAVWNRLESVCAAAADL